MSEPSSSTAGVHVLRLDPSLYKLGDEEASFFKQTTGIKDGEKLRQHILEVQKEAYAVYPYPCIGRFGFTTLRISRHPIYDDLLRLGKERSGILLDVGCCFGNDARKAVADGYPVNKVIASDLEPAFWQLGHRLFKSTPESFPVPFIAGDAFDPAFLEPSLPIYSSPSTPPPDLSRVTTLTELRGQVSAIHASALFHLFDEEKQLALARSLASLLAPHPGAMIFGSHGAAQEKRVQVWSPTPDSEQLTMFCHSPESWRGMWESILGADKVMVETALQEVTRGSGPEARPWYWLAWSVKRL
ncbi:hypothetical protein FOMPIDRAFT_86237 [Fomitopsis schrenkii]|uniref:Methyltransferase domain-containing protein n=1 Tax=Fomitopsis schrenkii TaxID=2126942 RepID=S8ECG1_FOMSC|nr:hypothetical protein FOMPIDRAFT_86237 [Fomitopsis schrenkii]